MDASRTPSSRIPDFGTNILYGKEDFRHEQFPGFSNNRFFVYVDYAQTGHWSLPPAKPELELATAELPLSDCVARIIGFLDGLDKQVHTA